MNAVGIDTSVLVRLITGTPEDQAAKALYKIQQLQKQRVRVIASQLVVYESFHVLHRIYNLEYSAVLKSLLSVLNSNLIFPEDGSKSKEALSASLKKSSPEFMNQLIRLDYKKQAESILTFDKKFSRYEDVELIA